MSDSLESADGLRAWILAFKDGNWNISDIPSQIILATLSAIWSQWLTYFSHKQCAVTIEGWMHDKLIDLWSPARSSTYIIYDSLSQQL